MSSTETEKFDPSRRRLCPDGACVGLLDEAGRCKVCGLTASGEVVAAAASPLYDESPSDDDADEGGDVVSAAGDEPEAGDVVAFSAKRKLCPDGACIGVIGENGRCKVCGQAG